MPFLHGVKDSIVNDRALPRSQKGRTFGKRCRAKPVGINGIRDRDLKKQLCVRKERTSGRILRKTVELEVEKQIDLPLYYVKCGTGHCERVGPLRNEKRNCTRSKSHR
jgi:hypothetical protein